MTTEMITGDDILSVTREIKLECVVVVYDTPHAPCVEALAVAATKLYCAGRLYSIRYLTAGPDAVGELEPLLQDVLDHVLKVLKAASDIRRSREPDEDREDIDDVVGKANVLANDIRYTLRKLRRQHVQEGVERVEEIVSLMRGWADAYKRGYSERATPDDVYTFVTSMAGQVGAGVKLIRGKDDG